MLSNYQCATVIIVQSLNPFTSRSTGRPTSNLDTIFEGEISFTDISPRDACLIEIVTVICSKRINLAAETSSLVTFTICTIPRASLSGMSMLILCVGISINVWRFRFLNVLAASTILDASSVPKPNLWLNKRFLATCSHPGTSGLTKTAFSTVSRWTSLQLKSGLNRNGSVEYSIAEFHIQIIDYLIDNTRA